MLNQRNATYPAYDFSLFGIDTGIISSVADLVTEAPAVEIVTNAPVEDVEGIGVVKEAAPVLAETDTSDTSIVQGFSGEGNEVQKTKPNAEATEYLDEVDKWTDEDHALTGRGRLQRAHKRILLQFDKINQALTF